MPCLFTSFLLLFSLAAFGQAFTPLRPFVSTLASASPNPTNNQITLRWWVSSDVATNVQTLSWPDRVLGDLMTNTAASAPTNRATGMEFTGSQFLKIKTPFRLAPSLSFTGSVFMIITPLTPAANNSAIIACDAGGNYNGGFGVLTKTDNTMYWWTGSPNGTLGSYSAGSIRDVVVRTFSNASIDWYTNGVFAGTNTYSVNNMFWDLCGATTPTTLFYNGKILELAFYQNTVTLTTVSNLHVYATNTYKYSP